MTEECATLAWYPLPASSPGAALGVPEHVTVMYPFLHPDGVGEAIVDRLEKICSAGRGDRRNPFISVQLSSEPQRPVPLYGAASPRRDHLQSPVPLRCLRHLVTRLDDTHGGDRLGDPGAPPGSTSAGLHGPVRR